MISTGAIESVGQFFRVSDQYLSQSRLARTVLSWSIASAWRFNHHAPATLSRFCSTCRCPRSTSPEPIGKPKARPSIVHVLPSIVDVTLDAQLEEFSRRPLGEEFPYVVVDARYERVREGGVIVSRAILIALGIDNHWANPRLCRGTPGV